MLIKKQAKKKLLTLAVTTRAQIAGQISMLGKDPDDERLDVKKMKGIWYCLFSSQAKSIPDRFPLICMSSNTISGKRSSIATIASS